MRKEIILITYKNKLQIIVIIAIFLVGYPNETGDDCSKHNPVECVRIVYNTLPENQKSFRSIILITYYGELSILDHTNHRDYVIEAFVRNIFDPQSGLTKCYDPAYYDVKSNEECILTFLSTSQHWRDSVHWNDYQEDWYVNIDRLTGKEKYLEYEDIMDHILNPHESWKQGQSYTRPSVWGNTINVKFENLPKETQDEIFVWLEYDYEGCQYSFFVATIEVRNIELVTCEQKS